MAETRDLLVRINGDTSGLNRAMGDASKSTDAGNKSFEGFQKAAGQVASVLQAAGAAITAYAITSTNFTVDYVRDAKTLARTTGETVTEASRLSAAFQRMGLDSGDTSATLNAFSRKIIAAKDDAADAGNVFQRLGVNIKNADGTTRGMSATLLDVADKFKAMPDGIDKNAAAMELFGRSGAKMIPILNKGRDGIQELEAQADKLGLTLTDKTIAGVAALIESQKKLKQTQDSLKIAVGTLTAPVLAEFYNKINDVAQAAIGTDSPFRGMIANVLAFGGPIATAAGGLLNMLAAGGSALPLFEALGISLGGVGAALSTFGIVAAAIAAVVGLIILGFGGWKQTVEAVGNAFNQWIKPALDALWAQIQTELLPALQQLWTALAPVLIPVLKVLGQVLAVVVFGAIMAVIGILMAVTGAVTAFAQTTAAAVNWVKGAFNDLMNFFRGIPGFLRSVLGGAAEGIIAPFRDAFNWIKNQVGSVKDALSNLNPFQRHSPSLVDYVQAGTRVIKQEYGSMFDSIKGQSNAFSAQGVASTLPATSAGPAPAPTGGSAPATFSPVIHLNLGMYAGMPVEKREIAVELWRELVREAKSYGVQLPQIGNVVQ